MGPDDMRVLHPGWDPRRKMRDRRRRPRWPMLLVLTLVLVTMTTCSLLRAVPEPPPNLPAFPADQLTDPPRLSPAPSAPLPVWNEGSAQVHPRTLPTAPARLATSADDQRECGIDDLSLANHGWDAATGNTATAITATNVTDQPCLLGGWPQLKLGTTTPTPLTFARVSRDAAGQSAPPARLVLAPGQGATTSLWWRGYRNAADQRTPQRLILRFGSGDWREIPLDAGAGPAPFDVIAGAEIEIGSWLPAAVGAAAETTAGGAV